MKKYVKLFTFLLSTTCLTEATHAASVVGELREDRAPVLFPITIPNATAYMGSGGSQEILPEILFVNSVGTTRDPESGRGYTFSRLTGPGGVRIVTATPTETANSETYDQRKKITFASQEDNGLEKLGFNDSRNIKEQRCDTVFIYAYKDVKKLYDELSYFASGEIESDLIRLLKATKKLDPSSSFIVGAVKLFPDLIKKTREKAILLKTSLGTDIQTILSAIGQIVGHLELYIDNRFLVARHITTDATLSLRDLLLLRDEGNIVDGTKVSLEGVDITDIHRTLFKIEETLNAIMKHNLKTKLAMISDFSWMTKTLDQNRPHSRQITELSKIFVGDLGVVEFIDRNWKSPEAPEFQSFKDGVKYINMLIESIRDYSVKAQDMAHGTAAKTILDELKTTTSTALVEEREASAITSKSRGMGTEEQQLKELVSKKRDAESSMVGTQLPDLQNLKGRIEAYLAT